jgi:hypothetical protein
MSRQEFSAKVKAAAFLRADRRRSPRNSTGGQ